MRHLTKIDDLSVDEIDEILARAKAHIKSPPSLLLASKSSKLAGLLFLETSLRTRVGYTAATARLGWSNVSITERRSSNLDVAEALEDTIRIASGMVDVLVARLPVPSDSILPALAAPLINAGDRGPYAEHPTQALIDLFAIQNFRGAIDGLHIAVCGDLRMRAVRSLLNLFKRYVPAKISAVSVPPLIEAGMHANVPPGTQRIETRNLQQLHDVDVRYVAGIPHHAIPEDVRDTLRVSSEAIAKMPRNAIILSPMPIIDEMTWNTRSDSRARFFQQSDCGVAVRMAVLEHLKQIN